MGQSVKLSVLGVTVTFACESALICEKLKQNYPNAKDDSDDSGISITIKHSLRPADELTCPPEFQISDNTLEGVSGGSHFKADRVTMTGEAYLCDAMLNSDYLLRHQVLNALTFYLLSYKLFTPIHCVCFQIEQVTYLCIGKSGAGKSTIALAAMLRGYRVLAEDVCFVGGSDETALYTDCREIHILPDSRRFFPELAKLPIETAHNGKLKCRKPIPHARAHKIKGKIKVLFIEPDHSQPQSTICECTEPAFYDELYRPREEGFKLVSKSRTKNVEWLQKHQAYSIKTGNKLEFFFKTLQLLQ